MILLFIVLLGVVIFAFTMGTLIRGNLHRPLRKSKQKTESRVKVKKTRKKPTTRSKDGMCKLPNGKVGILKNLPKERAYEEVCPHTLDCEYFFKCIGVE
jgi:hypothetical protein